MLYQKMFSLFELEKISEEELLELHPNAKGKNVFQTRANIALILKSEGNLKDCPLFDTNKTNSKYFFELLSMDLQKLTSIWVKIIYPGPSFSGFINKYRILFIYCIQTNMIIMRSSPLSPTGRREYPSLFENSIYYDESYYKMIESLSDSDLFFFENPFGYVHKPWMNYNIRRELAKRIYIVLGENKSINISHDIQIYLTNLASQRGNYSLTEIINISVGVKIHLAVLASQRENYNLIDMIDTDIKEAINGAEPGGRHHEEHNRIHHYYYVSIFYPTIENVKSVEYDSVLLLNVALSAISAVSETSPYEHITYEQFIETIQFLLEKSNMTCEEFFSICVKPLQRQRSVKFLLAAMVRLCGNQTEIGKLTSKYTNISYIPHDLYQ